jgi:hypothetical protein
MNKQKNNLIVLKHILTFCCDKLMFLFSPNSLYVDKIITENDVVNSQHVYLVLLILLFRMLSITLKMFLHNYVRVCKKNHISILFSIYFCVKILNYKKNF